MIKINEDLCIGCRVCVFECPDGFELVGEVVKLKNNKAKGIKEAVGICPTGALSESG